jgi:threonine synthase
MESLESLPRLRIGDTPLYTVSELESRELEHELYLKDDSVNPTYSLKDRASGVVSAVAKERGKSEIVTASTGNAGSSLAGICAAQGQNAIVLVPADAPRAKLIQIAMYGAIIVAVEGTYDVAFELSKELTAMKGWYNRNTAYNPYTIEGKKTVSFEIYDQLGMRVPDAVFVPVGDGCIICGVYKGFEDLLKLDITRRIPRIYAVQSERSSNLARNLGKSKFSVVEATTLADSISVDVPRNFRMTEAYLSQYNGEAVVVSDEQILSAARLLSRNTGLFAEPAASAAVAGYLSAAQSGKITAGSKNVILLTGSGLKDLSAFEADLPAPVQPELEAVESSIRRQQRT